MTKSLPSPITRMSQAMIVLGICAALIVAFVNLRDKPVIQFVEGELLDARFLLRGPVAVDPEIELVLIGEGDFDADNGGLSPSRLREGVAAVSRLGATAIILDPRLLKQSAPGNKPETATEEAAIARAVSSGGNVIVPYVFSLTPAEGGRAALPASVQRTNYSLFKNRDSSTVKRPVEAGGYQAPDAEILSAGTPGHVTYARQLTLSRQYAYPVIGYGGSYYPSLAMQAFLKAAGLGVADVEVNFGEGLRLDGKHLPMDSQMRLAVNYHGPGGSYRQTPFADLLDGAPEANSFRGKLVVLGFAPSARSGAFTTPYDPALSEAEFLANVIDNLKRTNPLIRSQQVIVLDILLLALIGLFFALLAAAKRIWTVVILSAIATGLFVMANIQAFIAFNLWLGLTFPLLSLLLCAGALVVAKHLSARRAIAIKADEEAIDEKYGAPWTFDRVAVKAPVRQEETRLEDEPQPEDELLTLEEAHEEPVTAAGEEKSEPGLENPAKAKAKDTTRTKATPAFVPPIAIDDDDRNEPVLPTDTRPRIDVETGIETGKDAAKTPDRNIGREPTLPEADGETPRAETEPSFSEDPSAVIAPAPSLPVPRVIPATEETPSPVTEKPAAPSSFSEKDRRDSLSANQKTKKPASLIPVMESSLRREKVILSSPSGSEIRSRATDELGVAVLFIKMRCFRMAVRGFGPTRSVQLLHSVYQLIDKTVVRNSGFLEQFGDEDVMAIFGLPDGDARDAENCLRASRELASSLAGWIKRQELSVDITDFCICADFGPVHISAAGAPESPNVSLSGYAIGLVSRMDKSVAAQGANVVVSEKLMAQVRETDLTGELKTGFAEQPMQQIPGSAEMTGLWRAVIGLDG